MRIADIFKSVENGFTFIYFDDEPYWYKVQVSISGEILMAQFGNPHGYTTAAPGEPKFESVFKTVIRGLMTNDKQEYVRMRECLNDKYKTIAEAERLKCMKMWDF